MPAGLDFPLLHGSIAACARSLSGWRFVYVGDVDYRFEVDEAAPSFPLEVRP